MNVVKIQDEKTNKDIVKLTITKILAALISTITSMLLARYRTLAEYGTYSQMLIAINLFTSFFMLGLPNCLNYFISRANDEKEKQDFINVYYTLSTILSFILGLSLSLSSGLLAKYFNNSYIKVFFYFLALYPWTKIISNSIENLLVVYKKTKFLMLIKVIHNLVLFGIVLLFEILKIPFEIYMISFTCFEVAFAIFDYFVIKKITGTLKPKFSKEIVGKIFKFSIPVGLASIVGIVNIELDKIVISQFFGTEELGIFTACSAELPLTLLASSITAVVMPVMIIYIKNGEFEKAIEKWKKTIIISFAIICLFSFGLCFFSDDAILLLYGEKYLPGSNVFKIYSMILMLKCTYWGMFLNSFGKNKFILISSIISFVINVILNYMLCLLFGFEGPAIATFISTGVMIVCQLIVTSKLAKVKFNNVMPWKTMIWIILINFAFGLVFSSLKRSVNLEIYTGGSLGETIILSITWCVIYMLAIGKKLIKLFREI